MNEKNIKLRCFFIVVVFCSLMSPERSKGQPSLSVKQNKSEQTTALSRNQELYQMIETLREVHLLQYLGLSGEKAAAVVERMRNVREIRRKYLVIRHHLENKVEALLGKSVFDQKEISLALQRLETTKYDYYQNLLDSDKALQEILTSEERAKYVLFQRNFNDKLKKLILDIRQENINSPQKKHELLRQESQESVIRQKN